jgi:hypothetical protein
MRRHECFGLPDAGHIDNMQGSELRQRICHRCIDVQWLRRVWHASP